MITNYVIKICMHHHGGNIQMWHPTAALYILLIADYCSKARRLCHPRGQCLPLLAYFLVVTGVVATPWVFFPCLGMIDSTILKGNLEKKCLLLLAISETE